MVEHHSHKIQNIIQKELFNAKSSIKIVVAWFTNDLLFQPLVLKQGAGVDVEIILNKDEINCSEENSIDFDELVKAGGTVRWNDTKQLMHDKFCIIDNNVVIYGSYNWTNKAEYNEESITVSKDEATTVNFYLELFKRLSSKYSAKTNAKSPTPPQEKKERTQSFTFSKLPPVLNEDALRVSHIQDLARERAKHPYIKNKAKPLKIKPHERLDFYDTIDFIKVGYTRQIVIAKLNGSFYLIDPYKWTPQEHVEFTDYKREDKLGEGGIWIKVDGKWGFYDSIRKLFVYQPICDEIKLCDGFTVFRIDDLWGLMDASSRTSLECKYHEILYNGNGEFRVKYYSSMGIYKNGQLQF